MTIFEMCPSKSAQLLYIHIIYGKLLMLVSFMQYVNRNYATVWTVQDSIPSRDKKLFSSKICRLCKDWGKQEA